ncbi:uncharacterized protein An16g06040 [Aspergillus niger]|uniref:Contig An16c0200, genomic contig n=2 Tax=Aspergillus niger TaxID=5061 RepID=A2R870_ASPNC|nr:uncharacterized protein An16g06040 [Aspergillus niger]CAK46944.1 unnamed protein product [Aspergillus niger]
MLACWLACSPACLLLAFSLHVLSLRWLGGWASLCFLYLAVFGLAFSSPRQGLGGWASMARWTGNFVSPLPLGSGFL